MSMTPINDADLSAYLDGELGAERRAEVEAWAREHPDAASKLRLWAADREALRARFDPVLDEPVPERLAAAASAAPANDARPGRGMPAWQRWAAALALFALGGVTGAALTWRGAPGRVQSAAVQPWVQRAVFAHNVYVPEVRHPVEVKAQEEHLARWLTRRLDVQVKLFDLREQGYELVGGRLLPDAGRPSAQLMYQQIGEQAGGAPPPRVTVYVHRPEDGTPAAFRYEQQGDVGMFYWVEGARDGRPACGYALVGALPRERLLELAMAIEKQW
jgi:anti-sigma factor RsiW